MFIFEATEIWHHQRTVEEVRSIESHCRSMCYLALCSRVAVATMTSTIGVMTSALLIAVLSQKLLLSRWEKYIYNFVLNIELAKARKTHAANIISNGWKIWKLTRRDKQDTIEYVNAQRKFFGSITTMHQIKQERRKLTDSIIGPAELMIAQRETSTRNIALEEKVATMGTQIDRVVETLNSISRSIQTMENKIDGIVNEGNRLWISLCRSLKNPSAKRKWRSEFSFPSIVTLVYLITCDILFLHSILILHNQNVTLPLAGEVGKAALTIFSPVRRDCRVSDQCFNRKIHRVLSIGEATWISLLFMRQFEPGGVFHVPLRSAHSSNPHLSPKPERTRYV